MAVLNNRGIGSLSGKPATHPIYPRGPTTDVYVIPNSHGPTGPGRVAGNLGNSGTTLMLLIKYHLAYNDQSYNMVSICFVS